MNQVEKNLLKKYGNGKISMVILLLISLKKLGCSCDWSRNAFTMDENLSKSVIKVFVELHNKKLIYKARKISKLGHSFKNCNI